MGLLEYLFGGKKKERERQEQLHLRQNKEQRESQMLVNALAKYEIQESNNSEVKYVKNLKIDDYTYTGYVKNLLLMGWTPEGFGKKRYGPELEMSGYFVGGLMNGCCYMNMHYAMITGHFKNNHPNGWCVSIEDGYQFGVMMNDDFLVCLSEHMTWISKLTSNHHGSLITLFWKENEILYGYTEKDENGKIAKAKGILFTKNGDAYFGIDDNKLSKTGIFVKYGADGYIKIGRFENGTLVEPMTHSQVMDFYFGDRPIRTLLPNICIDINKKYF